MSELVTKDVRTWLKSLILRSNSPDGIWMRSIYRDDKDELRQNILYLSKVVSISAGIESGLSRPAIAFRATKDSHMLDSKTVLYKMLLYYLSYTHNEEYPGNPEDVGALLDRIGIIDDTGYRAVMS